jgi:hypothetical protein
MKTYEVEIEWVAHDPEFIRKIEVIKYIRRMTGRSLKEAKDFMDALYESFNHDPLNSLRPYVTHGVMILTAEQLVDFTYFDEDRFFRITKVTPRDGKHSVPTLDATNNS